MKTLSFSKVRVSGHRVIDFLAPRNYRTHDRNAFCIGGKTFKVTVHSGTRYNEIEVLPVGIDTLEEMSQWCIELAEATRVHEDMTGDRVGVEMVVLYS